MKKIKGDACVYDYAWVPMERPTYAQIRAVLKEFNGEDAEIRTEELAKLLKASLPYEEVKALGLYLLTE